LDKNDITKLILVEAAEDLNKVMGLDPQIPTGRRISVAQLQADIVEASGELRPEDRLRPETIEVLDVLLGVPSLPKKKGSNPNHPKKGSFITVDPIRDVADVRAISKMLYNTPRDHLLFIMGINNGLRTGDLLKLKVGDVSAMKPGDTLRIKEGKTGKINILAMTPIVHKALNHYLKALLPPAEHYLFRSKKGANKPLSIQAVNNYVKKWTRAIHLRGNYGAHTLRKTFGYIQRTRHGVGFEILCDRFNHSSPAVTQRYLGIEKKEVIDILMNNEIG
jgi:integrase